MAETINMPKLGFDMAEGTLVRWVKKEGEDIQKGDVLAEIETDKATVEVESSASGVLRKLLVDEGAVVPINTPIAIVGTKDEKIEAPAAAAAKPAEKAEPAQAEQPSFQPASREQAEEMMKVSPLARRMARENKIDLGKIQGSGPNGRIVRRDVEAALQHPRVPAAPPPAPLVHQLPTLKEETHPLSKLRTAIARRMTEAKTTIPHFYVTHEYKMEKLITLRKEINAVREENEKISVNDFIVKAVALTLHQFPNLNASLSGSSVIRRGEINIGVAVSLEGGLMTVVCRNADLKSLGTISAEIKAMAAHAREGKVKPEEVDGSTFSVSNMGMYDVENFSAIINPPEAGILAVGTAREVAVVENGEVKPGWRMKATISIDHRVSDGVEGAKFMQALANFIEEPLRLFV